MLFSMISIWEIIIVIILSYLIIIWGIELYQERSINKKKQCKRDYKKAIHFIDEK